MIAGSDEIPTVDMCTDGSLIDCTCIQQKPTLEHVSKSALASKYSAHGCGFRKKKILQEAFSP